MSITSSDSQRKISQSIDFISNTRATNTVQQNRLEQTASESKISDIDMAQESNVFAKFQILNQVSNAMLAQVNPLPQQVMQLIS